MTTNASPFARLLSHPGVQEQLELRSRFGFMAFHGGSLERHTHLIAGRAAEAAGASFYAVVQPADFRWHIPSSKVDPDDSPALASFLGHVDVTISVHGYGRGGFFTTLLLGGRNRELAVHLGGRLATSLGHYQIAADIDHIPADLRGLHPDNPVNRPRAGGVQLELPPRVRGMGPFWQDWPYETNPHTEALVDTLAEVARSWPLADNSVGDIA